MFGRALYLALCGRQPGSGDGQVEAVLLHGESDVRELLQDSSNGLVHHGNLQHVLNDAKKNVRSYVSLQAKILEHT